jgi:[acyl-carrier-protein] S-malonyltransferase
MSIAHLAAWREIDQTPVAMLAGHSAGQYAAAVAAEAIEFEDALLLIQARARLMSQAVAGGMVAVLGLPQTQLKPLIAAAREYGEIGLANDNSPGQIVLAGIVEAVAAVPQLATAAGARRTVVLPINVASHSPLMRRVRIELAAQLESVAIQSPRLPIMSNLRAELVSDADRLRFELAQHLVRPVRWRSAVEKMIKLGIGHFIEVGPGRVLTGLVRRIDGASDVRALDQEA